MNYDQIKNLALSYADREDVDVINRMDDFLRVTESRINRYLDVGEMFNRAVMVTQDDQEYYGLPSDFSTLRDIEIHSGADTNSRITPAYYSPEQFNTAKSMTSGSGPMYTIIANQIQISPVHTGDYIEIVYAQKIPELNEKNAINWISESAPDLYVFGLLVEISAFTKDATAAQLWEQRFQSEIAQTDLMDKLDRWSGSSLQIRVG